MGIFAGQAFAAARERRTLSHVVTRSDPDPWARARERMLASITKAAAPRDPRVLAAFERIPREAFVPEPERRYAYEDRALPIGQGQTISQPTMIAIMLDALACDRSSRVLEVGAGSGYAAALLSCLAAEVDAVEILPDLAARAAHVLAELGLANVRVHVGDGSKGLPERAPFDRILVSAGAEDIPRALVAELAPGGRIAIPVGDHRGQVLHIGDKDLDGRMRWRRDVSCMFVPLIGG
jgi:protein-L-isoaspartate(D-aspartate) O-methyltransferase